MTKIARPNSNLAQVIRDLWCEERRLFDLRTTGLASDWGHNQMATWDGGSTADGKHHESVWKRIAALCQDNNIDPVDLIRAIFHKRMLHPPNPNEAAGPSALEKYRQYTSAGTVLEIKTRLIHELEAQKSRTAAGVASLVRYRQYDEQTAYRVMLVSRDEPLSPLWRYCVAKNQGWDEIAEKYEPSAKCQFNRHPKLYVEAWGVYLPEEMRKEVSDGAQCATT